MDNTHLLDCENRRIAPRLKKTVAVGVRHHQESFRSHTINISATGVRLVLDSPLTEPQELELHLQLREDASVSLKGRTVWQHPIGSMGVHVVGVEFSPDQDEASRLYDWLGREFKAA